MVSIREGMRLAGARRHSCSAPDDFGNKTRWLNTDGSNRPAPYGPYTLLAVFFFGVGLLTWTALDHESADKFVEVVLENGIYKIMNIPIDFVKWIFHLFR